MRAFVLAIVGLLASASPVTSSFHGDVVRRTHVRKNQLRKENAVNDELLAKAIPIQEFEEKHQIKLSGGDRQLEQYQMDDNVLYSFSGYSLTFAKCQPVQYFSDDAVEMGSYSPMITQDIVVLRLCPSKSCSDSKEYGCYYNYAEYAIDLTDYMNIMLRYAAQKKEYMCEYCNDCLGNNGNRRRLEEEGNEENQNEQNNQDEQEQDQQEDNNEDNNEGDDQQQEQQENDDNANDGQEEEQQEENDDAADAGDDAAEADYNNAAADDDQGDDYYQNACEGWDTYCSDYADQCVENENEGGNYYMDYEDYLDYLECSEVNYNDNRYYVKPRCDGYKNTIKMMVHYDAYCMQTSGGNDMSIKNLGLGMRDSMFQDFYSGECVDCSESVSVNTVLPVSRHIPFASSHFSSTFSYPGLPTVRCHEYHVQLNALHRC